MRVKSVWIEAEQWAPGEWTPEDDNTDVLVTLSDGSRWTASFFSYRNIGTLTRKNRRTGECLGGKYFWSGDLILVDRVSRDRIEEVVSRLAYRGPESFGAVFRRVKIGRRASPPSRSSPLP